ncbi:hypothetical protein, partial [uncultured Eubacterium sp.]|uniref:hypothetical protein n=1 Tax=uncultured Eubacterium sp. TaxID=165185 RepID=UPI0032646AA4
SLLSKCPVIIPIKLSSFIILFYLHKSGFVRLKQTRLPAALYQKRLKAVQVVNFYGGAVKNAVLAVFLRRHPAGKLTAAAASVAALQTGSCHHVHHLFIHVCK